MTRNDAELKGLMRNAVTVKQDYPTLSIPAVMRVEKFTKRRHKTAPSNNKPVALFTHPPCK
jgi:hypothetical protein